MQQQLMQDEQGNVWDMSSGSPVLVRPAQGPNVVVPAAPKDPPKREFVPGHPGVMVDPTQPNAPPVRIPGIPDPKPAPNFVPGQPGYVVTGPPDAPTAVPIKGLPGNGSIDPEKRKAIEALQQQLDRVSELYRAKIQGGMPNPIWGHMPTGSNTSFDSAAAGLVGPYQSAFRVPGVGSQSDTELKQFQEGGVPKSTDTDAAIAEKIANLQRRIDTELQKSAPVPDPAADQVDLAHGKTRSEVDPVLKATALKVGRMLSAGVPGSEIEDFLRKSGVDPASTDLAAKLRYRATPEYKRWQRANPGQPYPIDPSLYTKEVPMSDTRALMNNLSQSAPAAFAAASANAISGGRLDNMTGDPELARTGMELLRGEHPAASFGGDLAGQALVEAGLSRIPGAQSMLATRWGRRGMDLGYGVYSGSGENDGDPLSGAAVGGLTNLGFGMFGRGLQSGAGRALTGVRNANLSYLDKAGVPLTIGQIGNGTDSVVGKAIGGLEDRAAGVPIFDSIINSARRRGERGFNSAAFREAGGSGTTGAAGVEELHRGVNNAYNFLDPVSLPLDAQFAGQQAGVRASLSGLPKFGQEIESGLNLIDNAAKDGSLTGRDWQQALRTVKADRSSLKGKEFSQGAVDALGDVENNLLGLANRQAPADLQGNLASANQLNKQFRTITAALDNGPSQNRGELFSPSRLNTASLAAGRKFGGQVGAVEGNRPFYELTKAGMDVMPNQVPDSGTAGRALLYSALFGGGGALGFAGADQGQGADGALSGGLKGLALSAAIAAPYSKTGQKALQKILLSERPDKMVKLGEFLVRNPKYAGMFASALGRDYVYQPEINIGQ